MIIFDGITYPNGKSQVAYIKFKNDRGNTSVIPLSKEIAALFEAHINLLNYEKDSSASES